MMTRILAQQSKAATLQPLCVSPTGASAPEGREGVRSVQ